MRSQLLCNSFTSYLIWKHTRFHLIHAQLQAFHLQLHPSKFQTQPAKQTKRHVPYVNFPILHPAPDEKEFVQENLWVLTHVVLTKLENISVQQKNFPLPMMSTILSTILLIFSSYLCTVPFNQPWFHSPPIFFAAALNFFPFSIPLTCVSQWVSWIYCHNLHFSTKCILLNHDHEQVHKYTLER